MNTLNVPETVLNKSREIINTIKQWPEDDWVCIGERWDLNLYKIGEDGDPMAVIYPVISGQTQTDNFKVVS